MYAFCFDKNACSYLAYIAIDRLIVWRLNPSIAFLGALLGFAPFCFARIFQIFFGGIVMTVKIDSVGRVVIPKEYRQKFNLKPNTEANMLPLPDDIGVSLFRLVPRCANCGEEKGLEKFENISLCPSCRRVLKYALK